VSPHPAAPALAPDTEARIQAALNALEQQISVARVTNDPLLHMLEALAATVHAQHRMFVDASLTIAAAIDEGRKPLSQASKR